MITLARTRPGFSLIEVLIVITIGGILVGAAVAGFNYIKSTQIRATKTKIQNLKLSIQQFQIATREFPASLEDLYIKPSNPAVAKLWTSGAYGVEDEGDLKDSWGNMIQYERRAKGNPPYEIYSWGPDGEGSPEEKWIKG